MQWKKHILPFGVLLGGLLLGLTTLPNHALGCEDDSCGDWGGMYATGLYSFGTDLYDISSQYVDDSWGGSCGSFYGSCSSAYSSAGYGVDLSLYYGGDNSCSSCDSSGFNPYSYSGDMSGLGGLGGYPSPYSLPPFSSGYPSPFPPGYPPPYTSPISPYSGLSPFSPIPPVISSFPSSGITTPPPYIPWGGCDGVIVLCPTGPVTPPVYNPYVNYVPNPPIPYQVGGTGSTYPPPIYTPPSHGGVPVTPGYPTTTPVYTPPSTGTNPLTYSPVITTNPTTPVITSNPRGGTTYTPPTGGVGGNPTTTPVYTPPTVTAPTGGSTTAGGGSTITYSPVTTVNPNNPFVYTAPRGGQ